MRGMNSLASPAFDKEVQDAERFGVAEIRGNRVVSIEEKPQNPKLNYAVIGVYLYDATVFQKIRRLKPSGRVRTRDYRR
jgi:glucose-1-phosphate thymidylyltransferase